MSKHEGFFSFARFILKPYVKKFNFEYDELSKIEGPYLLLSNHTTDYDPIFVGLAAGRSIRFVASEHLAHKGLVSKLLIHFTDPIIHQKGRVGIATTKSIIKALRGGDCVALFPEGGRSFNGETGEILSSTAKLVKSSGASLVTVRIIGGYEVQPRWGTKLNKGKITLRLSNVYKPDELKAFSDEDLMSKITEDLYVKASVPTDLTGIESTLFMAKPEEINPDMDIANLDRAQKAYVLSGSGDFSDDADLYEVGDDHTPRLIRKGRLHADSKGFSFDNEPLNVSGAAVISRNTLILHDGPKHYELRGDIKFSALKYLYQYNYLCGIQ